MIQGREFSMTSQPDCFFKSFSMEGPLLVLLYFSIFNYVLCFHLRDPSIFLTQSGSPPDLIDVKSDTLETVNKKNFVTQCYHGSCSKNASKPFIERDTEDTSSTLPLEAITDFVTVPVLFKKNLISKIHEGCVRSAPLENSPSMESFALGQRTQNALQKQLDSSREHPSSKSSMKLCPQFNEVLQPHPQDWENGFGSSWVMKIDQDTARLLYSGPVRRNVNELLVAKFKGCVPGKYQARIRLMDESQAGIAFRIPLESTKKFYAVTLSSKLGEDQLFTSYINLNEISYIKDIKTLFKKKNQFTGPEMVASLTVIDHGTTGKIDVLLNDKPVFSKILQKTLASYFRAGIFLISGAVSISEISFSPYEVSF